MADKQEWLEISLVVSGELAEAINDVFTRHIPGGVVIERSVSYDASGKPSVNPGETRICGYLLVDALLENKRTSIEEGLWHLGTVQQLPDIKYELIQDQNWMEKWKERYHPILVGEKLLILPPWLENPHPDRIPLRIDPNMAFGTGTHPTTQLCLKMVEKHLTQGMDMIDLGCGSGILSIAAHQLGAGHVLAVDIDPLSVKATQENALLNNLPVGIETGLGSVAEVIGGQFGLQHAPAVLANILASVIVSLFGEGLGVMVTPGGNLILSGILDHQSAIVQETAMRHGFELIESDQMEDWVVLVFRKPTE